ncbi:hypothetical protein FHR75_004463 [Kineococcus radiotolerans]|uniref:Serine aminopeptidase S33 domain-containing protein n=1 Tax=Kineococcus radiotolerans TaxID=131568 RepID=A0A7W4TR85_KINRA|nr:alpha/beta fold hydrolase [Kineococcus radiotolerans]MBB2903620.1 hypothetical protein [Kineococcus radiotolerans]
MHEHQIHVTSGEHVLVGSLLLPEGEGLFPAVLLVPGSGPVNRDSDHPRARLGITRQFAHALAQAGVASLRYDKRGVGASTGDFKSTGLHENADDAGAALAALSARPEVAASAVFLLGHSEGALLAAAVAARGRPVAGVVLISCSAAPGEEVLRWQAAQIAASLPPGVRVLLRLLRTDLVRQVRKNHDRIRATTTDTARIGLVRLNARWTREFMAHDPREDLARIHAPVLAVTGGFDLQVDPAHAEVIAVTVAGPAEAHVVPGVSHVLRSQSGRPSLNSYGKDVRRPVDSRVLGLVTDWVTRHSGSAVDG